MKYGKDRKHHTPKRHRAVVPLVGRDAAGNIMASVVGAEKSGILPDPGMLKRFRRVGQRLRGG